jgi:Cu(I)-responsive transcriptional regulator
MPATISPRNIVKLTASAIHRTVRHLLSARGSVASEAQLLQTMSFTSTGAVRQPIWTLKSLQGQGDNLVKIGELARSTGTKVETIRFYEKIGLLPAPERTEGNYRDYSQPHLARLSFVRRARDLGFTLDQVRALLTLADDRDQSCGAVDVVARDHLSQIDRKIADLQALRRELDEIISQCGQGAISECRIIEALGPSTATH